MATEAFLVTALPHSADPAAARHLSLFVTHRLTPDGAQGTVADFPHVRDWTALLAGATVTVTGRAGGVTRVVPATADLTVLDPSLWPRVFPPDLPVLPWQVPDRSNATWRTFPAHRMQAHALLAHGLSLLSSPVVAPTVAGNLLSRTVLSQIFDLPAGQDGRGGFGVERLLEGIEAIDRRVTERLDEVAGSRLTSAATTAAGTSPILLLAADAHLARRYYQRPEEQRPYQPQPDGSPTPPVVQEPPDFHRRAALLGDLSPLLRRLGLVVDVHVDDLASLAGITEISADITIAGLYGVPAQPWVRCAVDGGSFTTVSGTGDWDGGRLRIGDEDAFTVLDLDPDASALKLEQYVRTVPRMAATEANGDRGTSAPSTLRATGFAVARHDRAQQIHDQVADAPGRDARIAAGTLDPLSLEDVSRGVRLEVWDDMSDEWHSLHRRRLTAQVAGAGVVLDGAPDTGFLQGASLTRADGVPDAPLNAHEVLAGWDGWSLSAPRPGKRVVHDSSAGGPVHEQHADPQERLEDPAVPAPDAEHPVATTSVVEKGTLPRLRYGRRYAFRAWNVDLAGNSTPHTVAGPPEAGDGGVSGGPAPQPAPDAVAAATTLSQQRFGALGTDALRLPGRAAAVASRGLPLLRADLAALTPVAADGPTGIRVGGSRPDAGSLTGDTDLDRLVLARRDAALAGAQPPVLDRRARIEQTVRTLLPGTGAILERTDTTLAPDALGRALATDLGSWLTPGPALTPAALDLVTTPRPFLRWEPVLEPTVVPRHAYSEAESQLTLVIRSGVEGPGPDGVTMTVVPAATFVPDTLAAHPELGLAWQVDCERHLLPPKTTQYECELHGLFDTAFGSGDPAQVKAALAIALREAGTLVDTTRADPDTPGARVAQPGVALVTGPTADDPAHSDPADIPRGDGLSRGQYVVHDVDTLVLPYLPDPVADGVAFVFPDAGRGTALHGFAAVESTRLPYSGTWPDRVPWRLVLASGDRLAADAEDDVVTVALPPGSRLRTRLSSSLLPASLDLLGLWRSLPAALTAAPDLRSAAADGWLWWLTPAAEVRLVHAVPRPLEAPRFTLLTPVRTAGSTSASLVAGVDLHGPSTERIDVEASWTEQLDDVTLPGPTTLDVRAAACHTPVAEDEDLVVLSGADADVPLPDGTTLHVHGAQHHFGDTKHRTVDYRLRATTRFREYFDPHLLPDVDDVSVLGPARRVEVPSTVRPPKPLVRDVLPLLRWSEQTEDGQPFAVSRTRRSGVRVYLDRPWFASGDGELLAVVLAPGAATTVADELSQWGADPAFTQDGPDSRSALPLTDLLRLSGLDDRAEQGRPLGPITVEKLLDLPGQPSALVLAYRPEFSAERDRWFVDVALDPGTAFWPFVRLTVARYQPHSLPGLALSKLVRCDFAQVLPQRTALLSRPDAGHARVVVTGPAGVPGGWGRLPWRDQLTATRRLLARLERRVPSVGTDLGWTTVTTVDLPVAGIDGTVVSWEGELELASELPPARPGDNPDWRVVIEEWEKLPADSSPEESLRLPTPPVAGPGAVGLRFPRTQERLVYADQLAL